MQEFNKGVYDYIIATDESGTHGADQDSEDEEEEVEEESNDENEEPVQQCIFFLEGCDDLLITSQLHPLSAKWSLRLKNRQYPLVPQAPRANASVLLLQSLRRSQENERPEKMEVTENME